MTEKKETWASRHQKGIRITKRCLLGGAISGGVLLACFLIYTWITTPNLDHVDVTPSGYRTTVLDQNGETIQTLMGEASNRIYAPLEEIPVHLQKAVIAIEDERFLDHNGIDLKGIARAFYRNLTSGRLAEGASTITQQLIKNNVFTDWTEEKTALDRIRRKLQEQYLALQLERREDKDWILENYLNTINLGSGTWGVKTAAMRYFGKDVSDLTLSECAVLAGITKSPSGYNPLKNPESSRERQLVVLQKMMEQGYITRREYDEAVADDVYEQIARDNTPVKGTTIMSYFEDALVYQVVDDLVAVRGCSEEDAWQMLYRGGLTIRSTQDSRLQEICESEINRDTWYSSDAQATVVMMDPYTGYVKALVGGRGEKTGSLALNRATSSVRQPGSTIKVIGEYAAALEQGAVTLGTVYDDAPYTYSNGTSVRNANGKYGGRTTLRRAIAQSTNIVALKCFQEVGVDAVFSQLQQFGLRHLTEGDRVEALALGGTNGGVTNLEMTAAYGAIANGGTYLEPVYYTEVLDQDGTVLLRKMQGQSVAVSASTASLLTSAMRDVITEGTGQRASFSGMTLAGKSGTSSELRDLWFVGFSPYYVCGVWGGFDDFSPQTGGGYVKQIWRAIMQRSHETLMDRDFTGEGGLVSCTICTKCGRLAVPGLCDSTVQGDMTRTELYVPGTEPTESCDCHVEVAVCTGSGQPAGPYCLPYLVERKAYLISGTPGTADAEAVVPPDTGETCQMHQGYWNWFFPADTEGGFDDHRFEEPERNPGASPFDRPGDGWGDW